MAEMQVAAEEVEASLAKALLLDSNLAVSLDSGSPHVNGEKCASFVGTENESSSGLVGILLGTAFCSEDSCCILVGVHYVR